MDQPAGFSAIFCNASICAFTGSKAAVNTAIVSLAMVWLSAAVHERRVVGQSSGFFRIAARHGSRQAAAVFRPVGCGHATSEYNALLSPRVSLGNYPCSCRNSRAEGEPAFGLSCTRFRLRR
jgi:hypothetical protein